MSELFAVVLSPVQCLVYSRYLIKMIQINEENDVCKNACMDVYNKCLINVLKLAGSWYTVGAQCMFC